jgi:hypothetical protein
VIPAALVPLPVRLRRAGIVYPVTTWQIARIARLGLPLGCAMLMQESSGGHNEFGHDPTIFIGAGKVTKARYLAYRALRDHTGECQGVGSCQLTSRGYQDQADKLGGCWVPRHNIAVGFHALAGLIREHGLKDGIAAYNAGPGNIQAGMRYAEHVLALAEHFKAARCGTVIGVY